MQAWKDYGSKEYRTKGGSNEGQGEGEAGPRVMRVLASSSETGGEVSAGAVGGVQQGGEQGAEQGGAERGASSIRNSMLCHLIPLDSYTIPSSCGPNVTVCCMFDFRRRAGGDCVWPDMVAAPQPITRENVAARVPELLDQVGFCKAP